MLSTIYLQQFLRAALSIESENALLGRGERRVVDLATEWRPEDSHIPVHRITINLFAPQHHMKHTPEFAYVFTGNINPPAPCQFQARDGHGR